jgi:hypothetical protein
MRNKIYSLSLALAFFITLSVLMFSCQKDEKMVVPPQKAFFIPSAAGTYTITGPTITYKIPVGLTQPLDGSKAYTLNISSSSTTGATVGTHYNFTNSLSFTGNNVTDTIIVTGVYDQYLAGRKDVVQFSFTDPESASPSLNNTFTLNIGGPCFEGDIVLTELLGDYKNTFDGSYGPYTTTVKSAVSTGPTTAEVVIANVYDYGWDDLTFTLDWSDPANTILTYDAQDTGFDAGNLNGSVAGHNVWATPPAGSSGTYSYCNKTITINYRLCMPTFGACFTTPVTTSMAR